MAITSPTPSSESLTPDTADLSDSTSAPIESASDSSVAVSEPVVESPPVVAQEPRHEYIPESQTRSKVIERHIAETNRALTLHEARSREDIIYALNNRERDRATKKESRVQERLVSQENPTRKQKMMKYGLRALQAGYWGMLGYGILTGTPPWEVIKDVSKIPSKLADFASSPIDAISKGINSLFGKGGVEKVAEIDTKTQGWKRINEKLSKSNLFGETGGRIADIPGEYNLVEGGPAKFVRGGGGAIYNMTKGVLNTLSIDNADSKAASFTKLLGRPFVAIGGGLFTKHTEYPVKGGYAPFLAIPGLVWASRKLGLVEKTQDYLYESKGGSLGQMKEQERQELKQKARAALLEEGNFAKYQEITNAANNIDEKYKALGNYWNSQQSQVLNAA